jgi:hypothetical protein
MLAPSVILDDSNVPDHILLRLQRAVAHTRRADADRFDSNTNPVLQIHASGCPTAHIFGSLGSSIPPSVPLLQCLRRHNERDSLRKFSHCPPRNNFLPPLCPLNPTLEYRDLSDATMALAMVLSRSALVLLTGLG